MGKPYSLDLRERIIDFVEEGGSRRGAAGYFGVSASCAIKLMDRFVRTGSPAADSDDCGQLFRLIAGSVPNDRGHHSERRRAVSSRRRLDGFTLLLGCQVRPAWRRSFACSRP